MIEPDLYRYTMQTLVRALPPPPEGVDTDYVQLAIEQMAAMAPANAAEADIAAHYIACTAHAANCLRMAQAPDAEPDTVRLWSKHGATLMREARMIRSQLMRVQATRIRRDADPVTRAQDAAVREAVQRGLQEALTALTREQRQAVPTAP